MALRNTRWMLLGLGLLVVFGGLGTIQLADRLSPDVETGRELPAVTFRDTADASFDPASLRGKVVLMEFWSST